MSFTMTRGIPASGKTTWAKECALKSGGKIKVICKDDLRAMFDAGKYSKEREVFINKVRNKLIIEALDAGYSVIVADTNISSKDEKTFADLAALYKTKFEIKEFHVRLEDALLRNRGRTDKAPVPDKVIIDMYYRLNSPNLPTYRNKELPPAIICDIDGTIARRVERSPFDMSRVGEDEPISEVIEIIEKFSIDHKIIFLSGRTDCYDDTWKWINANINLHFHTKKKSVEPIDCQLVSTMFMREVGDVRKDCIFKKDAYNKYIKDVYDVKFVIDDRAQVVSMWRDELNLRCLEAARHLF